MPLGTPSNQFFSGMDNEIMGTLSKSEDGNRIYDETARSSISPFLTTATLYTYARAMRL